MGTGIGEYYMLPLNPWEHQNAIKALYSKCVETVCEQHDITRMELDILLFLANNPLFDTATDIVDVRYLSKSQVSTSIKMLEKRGYLEKYYEDDNRKTAHLRICDAASHVIVDGREAQEKFLDVLFQGIPEKELEILKSCNQHIVDNIHCYLSSVKKCDEQI